MRFYTERVSVLSTTLLLSSCAATTANYYTQTIQSWRGGNAQILIKRWGQPDQQLRKRGGGSVYLYRTQSYNAYHSPVSPFGVPVSNNSRQPNTNNVWNRGLFSLTCSALFETNAKGVIVNTQIEDQRCYGNENFAKKYSNPGT
jgi:hypothetical protein